MPSIEVVFRSVRSAVGLALCTLALGAYITRSGSPLADELQRAASSMKTTLPARIGPVTQWDLLAEAPADVVTIHSHPGEVVEAGDLLVVLESRELAGQVEAARKRLQAAATHLHTVRSNNASARNEALLAEQMTTATRNRDMARQRLEALRLADRESDVAEADRRLNEIQSLVQRGLATDAELRLFQERRADAERELTFLMEHRSRLMQELAEADSRIRLLEIEASGPSASSATVEADYADAQAALEAAQLRLDALCITAPARGTVLSVDIQAGERVTAGALLLRIADLSDLTVSAPVAAALARRIKVGRPMTVVLPAGPSRRIPTEVKEITLSLDAFQQAYLIKAVIPNPDPETVFVGLEAQLEIEHSDAL